MKYKDFIKLALSRDFEVTVNDDKVLQVENEEEGVILTVDKTKISEMWVSLHMSSDEYWHSPIVIDSALELVRTPLEERAEKRYIVPLPHLQTIDGEPQYLSYKAGVFFAGRRNECLRQTWKEEHLKYIPEVYRQFAEKLEE